LNLTNNAVKFTHSGTVTISVDAAADSRVRFSVVDTGIGIGASVRHSLLDPFSQADSSTTRRFGGTGLGLAICAELVGLMGGTLDFDSEVGRGSTFWFEIPLPPVDGARSPDGADGDLVGARVLLADDARINRLVGVAILERLGCVVDVVANGVEAVEAVRRTRYDAVLMECMMPVMDGFDAADRIRQLEAGTRRTPIIAVTASATAADRVRCLAAGMDECLSKPLDRAALAGALARHCAAIG
jgi:CheY-like chemotaxis protein